jgi:hypothetical protein
MNSCPPNINQDTKLKLKFAKVLCNKYKFQKKLDDYCVIVCYEGHIYFCVEQEKNVQVLDIMKAELLEIHLKEIDENEIDGVFLHIIHQRCYIAKTKQSRSYGDNQHVKIKKVTTLSNQKEATTKQQIGVLMFTTLFCQHYFNIFDKKNQTFAKKIKFYKLGLDFIGQYTYDHIEMKNLKFRLVFDCAFKQTKFQDQNKVLADHLKNHLIFFGAKQNNMLPKPGKITDSGKNTYNAMKEQEKANMKQSTEKKDKSSFRQQLINIFQENLANLVSSDEKSGQFIICNDSVQQLYNEITALSNGAYEKFAKQLAMNNYTIELIVETENEDLLLDFAALNIPRAHTKLIIKTIREKFNT